MQDVLKSFLVHILFLTIPMTTLAEEVDKRAVILKEVRELTDDEGHLVVREKLYAGGISGQQSHSRSSEVVQGGVMLRELQAPKGSFTINQNGLTIIVHTLPIVSQQDSQGKRIPAIGRWDFETREVKGYKNAIHVKRGGDLDIVFQSTGMHVGDHKQVVHYGLGGNPHAISLSRKRLKEAYASQPGLPESQPIINQPPPEDILLVQMEFTPEGLLFQPILDHPVSEE